jgi:hypothetical protein
VSIRDDLLAGEEAGWHELWLRLHKLGEQDWFKLGAADDWTAKDVLAHIACWHAEGAHHLECLRMTGTHPRWPDVEAFNVEAHQRCAGMTLREVQAMSGAARHRFREELAACPEEHLTENRLRAFVGCAHGHYPEHIVLLDTFLGSG